MMKKLPILFFVIVVFRFQIYAQQTDTAFKPKGKVIFQVFFDSYYDMTINVEKDKGFEFTRAQFGYQYAYSPKFSSKVILDLSRPTTVNQIQVFDSTGKALNVVNNSKNGSFYSFSLKYACLQYILNDNIKFDFGAIRNNNFKVQEDFFGLRYVDKTYTDSYFNESTSDLGFDMFLTLNDKISLDFSVINGVGYLNEQNAFGDLKYTAGLSLNPFKSLQMRLYYDYYKTSAIINNAEQQIFIAFVGYQNKFFKISTEYNYQKNYQNISNCNLYGYTFFLAFNLSPKMRVFGRLDHLKSNIMPNKTQQWNFNNDGNAITAGLHYAVNELINVSLNYKSFLFQNTAKNVSNKIFVNFDFKF